MDELARRAGVTKPVVYELFDSKDALFRACLERSAERLAIEVAPRPSARRASRRRAFAPVGSPSCASRRTTASRGS